MDTASKPVMTRGQRLLRRMTNLVWGITLAVVLLLALYVGLGRQVMAHLHHFTEDLEYQIAAQIGQPVSIKKLSGDWRGLDPVVTISGLDILQEEGGEVAASLGELRLRLDSRVSLQRWRIVFREFAIGEADVTVVQQQDGRMGLEGIWRPPEEDIPGPGEVLDQVSGVLETRVSQWIEDLGRILNEPAVQVENVRIGLVVEGESTSYYVVPRADLVFRNGLFRASGHLQRADSGEQVAVFSLEGKHFFTGRFDGRAFLELSSQRLFDSLVRRYHWDELAIEGMDVNAKGWFHFSNGQPVRGIAQLDAPFLKVSSTGEPLPPLEDLAVNIGWNRQQDGWQMSVSQLHYRWQDEPMLPVSAALRKDSAGFSVHVDQLDAGPLVRLIKASGVLPDWAEVELAERVPTGRLRHVWLDWPETGRWQFASELEDVAIAAYAGAPQVSGLSGYLSADALAGELIVTPGPLQLGFPELFVDSWAFDRFRGRISWQRQGAQWRIGASDLSSVHESQARFDGGFLLRIDPADENVLSLRVGVADGHTDLLPLFVPKHVVAEELYDFLSQRIEGGEVPWGWYYGHGTVEPGLEHPAFTSSMQYDFTGARVRYQDDWPTLTEGRGRVTVQNAFAHVDLQAGRVADTDLEPSTIKVQPTEEGTRVDVASGARLQGSLLSRAWREESPLVEILGEWLEDVEAAGTVDLTLDLGIFPAQEQPPELNFTARLADVRVSHEVEALQWDRLNGNLSFDSTAGFRNSILSGEFLGAPVDLELRAGGEQPLQARQRGELRVEDLSDWLERPLPGLAGSLDYTATLRVAPDFYLRLDADVTPLASDWPAPLNKSAGVSQSLTSTWRWQEDGSLRVQGNWQDRLATHLVFRDQRLDRGSVTLGVRSTQLPETRGLEVSGFVPVIDVNEWRAVLDQDQGRASAAGNPQGSAAEKEEAAVPDWLQSVRISTSELRALGRDFGGLALAAQRDDDGYWRAGLKGNAVEGEAYFPAGKPVELALQRLAIPAAPQTSDTEKVDLGDRVVLPEEGRTEASGLGALTAEQRDSIPDLDVKIESLKLDGREQGEWAFSLRSGNKSLRLEALTARFDDLVYQGELIWSHAGTVPRTMLKGSLSGGNIGALERWFEQGVPLRSNDMGVHMDLSWRGAPDAMTLANLQGTLQFWLEDGRILEDSDAARIFRIFGLLNTDTIWRRLRLDFSDVYEAGISFDSMEGRALITEGRLILDPDLTIRAPSGGFRMSGQTDLLDETLSMRLVVVLPVTQNLPLAAVLVGAAPVAGMLYVVDRLFGGSLSRITSATYSLEGTWQEPDVRLRNVFDTESDLRRYERPVFPGGE